ncbi:hypothetical protein C1X90_20455, partial [Pseudomonas sp. GP01-A9]
PPVTLRVTTLRADAERPALHSHAERGNDHLYLRFNFYKTRLFGAPHHDACSPIHPRFPSVRRSESR